MKCMNVQFGEIDYAEEHLFEFPQGVIGFEHLHRFIVVNDADAEPFRWLVSVQDSDICFPIIDPKLVDPAYDATNQLPSGSTVAVIASLKDPIEESTVNMRSPLLFDAEKRTGKQIVLENERCGIQQRFISEPQLVVGE